VRVPSEAALIGEVHSRLVRKFAHLHPDQISAAVADAHARFAQSKVRDFVPLLVERRVSDQLGRPERPGPTSDPVTHAAPAVSAEAQRT
jgi:hypothetical protein